MLNLLQVSLENTWKAEYNNKTASTDAVFYLSNYASSFKSVCILHDGDFHIEIRVGDYYPKDLLSKVLIRVVPLIS